MTQAQVSAAAGISRSYLAEIETTHADPSISVIERLGEVLGVRFDLVTTQTAIVMQGRVRDGLHTRCATYVARRLRSAGWLVVREVPIEDGRLRGFIDVLAFDPIRRILLIIEIKTAIEDIGRLERQIAWYERAVLSSIPSEWRPARVVSWALALASAEVDQVVGLHRRALEESFPGRAGSMRTVADGTALPDHRCGLALIDPHSRRRDWLIATHIDGRRSPLPYQDRAGAARLLGL